MPMAEAKNREKRDGDRLIWVLLATAGLLLVFAVIAQPQKAGSKAHIIEVIALVDADSVSRHGGQKEADHDAHGPHGQPPPA